MKYPTFTMIYNNGEGCVSYEFTKNSKEVIKKEVVGELSATYYLEDSEMDCVVLEFANYMFNDN